MSMKLDERWKNSIKTKTFDYGLFEESKGKYTYTKWRSATKLGSVPLIPDNRDILGIVENFEAVKNILTYEVTKAAARVVLEMFRRSQMLVPHDTGELKQSGKVHVGFGGGRGRWAERIAEGTYMETSPPRTDLRKLSRKRYENANKITFTVQYYRLGDRGLDVAWHAHENLNPPGGPSPAVRKLGRSPKYLERPVHQLYGEYLKAIQSGVQKDALKKIKSASKVVRRRKGKYEVDIVTIDRSKID